MLEPQIAINALIDQYDPGKGNNIGTLVNIAKANGWTSASPFDDLNEIEDIELAQPVTTQKYKLLNRDGILALPPLEWRVKGVLPTRGIAAIYGPSGSGKSFLAIDVATAICLGTDWFGKKCKPTSVIYLGLEGSAGIQNRVKAWEVGRNKQLPPNFSAVLADFDLTDPADVQAIIDQTPKASVLIIDTLNRATPGRDENSSSDMGLTLARAKWLEQAIEGLVVLIHHTGKDQAKGLRGHSSLYAALDSAIAVTKTGTTKAWSQAKAKDGPDEEKFYFRLQSHVIGKDEDGANETSCTVEPEPSALQPQRPPTPKGSQQKPAYAALKNLIDRSSARGKGNASFHTCCVNLDSAVTAITETLGTVDQGKRSNRAKTLIDSFVSAEFLITGLDESGNAWYWLPE
jgi:putative DNA primase/helicase